MSAKGFWWASVEGREPQVIEVSEMTAGHEVAYVTGLEVEIDLSEVRLIKRVLPGGRATAGALHGALVAASRTGSGYVSRLQGCEVTDEAGETVGHTTLVDGYFDLQRAAEILAAGGGAA